jgi:pimeloyl-ACP methyl ester carboxylesterase
MTRPANAGRRRRPIVTRSVERFLAGLALVPLLVACGTSTVPATPTAPVAPTSAPTSGPTALAFEESDVAIAGGRTLHLVCTGPANSSAPTVVFEEGLGDESRTWVYVMSQLTTARTCAYDRAGNGQSPAAAGPRTTEDQVEDLDQLIDAAGIRTPIILVGWSLGGWNAMLYADRHPGRIASVVLVDVRPPTASAKMLAELPPEQPGESEALAGNRDEFTIFELDPSLNTEALDIRTSAAQVAASSFGGIPVRFLWAKNTAELWDGLDPELAGRLDAVLVQLRADMEKRAGADASSTFVDAGHDIPEEAPQAIIDAIRGLLGGAAG